VTQEDEAWAAEAARHDLRRRQGGGQCPGRVFRSLESKLKPIEIIMACEAGRISIGEWS
jgi:hypothetical protein